jgi:hypothetical protein
MEEDEILQLQNDDHLCELIEGQQAYFNEQD